MDVLKVINTIRSQQGADYQSRIPVATRENFTQVGTAILEYEPDTNTFLYALVNKIGLQEVSNRRFKNPLSVLKKGGVPFGTTVEELYTNPVKSKQYDGNNTSDMLEVNKPDTKTLYHKKNRESKYPVSINTIKLQEAFHSPEAFQDFYTTSIFNALYSGDEMDEFLLMKNAMTEAIAAGKIISVEVEYDGEETSSKGLIKLLKTLSGNFTFPKTDYNGYNAMNADAIEAEELTPCITWTPTANQIVLVRTDVDASTDVEVLAKAFNMDKTDFLKRKFVIDDFGDDDTLCVLCDENMFKFKDIIYQLRSFNNGSNLVTNYWLHHHQMISLSLFANALAIKKKAVEAEA